MPRGRLGRAAILHAIRVSQTGGAMDRRLCAKTTKNFVRGVLNTGVGLVELTRGLRSELAKLVTILDVRKCSKNKI